MAEEEVKKEKKEEKKKGFNFKVILIGLPLFIIQLVLVYFITATFLVKSAPGAHSDANEELIDENGEVISEDGEEGHSGTQKIYSIEDLIINPAGTNGQRLLLLSVGFGVSDEEKLNVLKENDIVIKDLVINTVAQKTLGMLSKIELKDSLKVELAAKMNEAYPNAQIKNVYFSKYLIN